MGRRPRRHQHERCHEPRPLPDPRVTGKAIAWAVVVAVTVWQTSAPSLCQPVDYGPQDAGKPEQLGVAPVPVVVLADAATPGFVLAAFPRPSPGQQRPPCPRRTVERAGGCWRKQDSEPPCDYYEVEEKGACYVAVPERPKGPPVAGGLE